MSKYVYAQTHPYVHVLCGTFIFTYQFSCPVVSWSVTSWTAAHQAILSITNSQSWLKLMSIESVMPSNHLILCSPLLLTPSIFPSIRVFSSESVLHIRWLKYWNFSFSISPSNEYSGLISFRTDSKESSPMSQLKSIYSLALSFLYSPILISIHDYWKNIALTGWTFVGKVMSQLLICCLGSYLSFQGVSVF